MVLSQRFPSECQVLRAQQPWPDHAFTQQWGCSEPWRSLTSSQRKRLLCLAAASGHIASLHVALIHCGRALTHEVLEAGAASGSLAVVERLLDEGCPFGGELVAAAAAGGSLEVLQLTLRSIDRRWMDGWLDAAARSAGAGGQLGVLQWLQQMHSHNPGTREAVEAAAWAGQVAVLEHLLPLVPARDAPHDALMHEDDHEGEPRRRAARLLVAITAGCPVEVLQRHYDRLWCWGAGQAEGAGSMSGAGSRHRQQEGDMDSERDMTASCLLAAAADSPTPCWSAKLDFLLSRFGPRMAREMLRGEREGIVSTEELAHRPDFLQRLRHLHAAGMRLGADMAEHAASCDQVEALQFLMGEAGARPNLRTLFERAALYSRKRCPPGHVAVLRLLWERGLELTPDDLVGASRGRATPERIQWLADVVDDMRGRGELDDERARELWSRVFTGAAATGASLPALQQLHALGAAIDLDAVAEGGIQEALVWAAAQLEGAGELQEGTWFKQWYGRDIATASWLVAHGLLSLDDWLGDLLDESHDMLSTSFWETQLWIQIRLQLPAVGPAAVVAAAAVMGAQPGVLVRAAPELSASEVLAELIKRSQEPGSGWPFHNVQPHQRAWLVRCETVVESAAAAAAAT
ncbi:hypothetical protein HXX76_002807 [Chlamydomonas incerta]|uniref:Ankyrin repeat domain-containing protein n=1 Tax=Chlamydomonas incerta TaxID=51695 RepID=A0A835TPA8_CHLIN|nr:hypothetical protein HXX76_002807 [Chlamydomonas incerta]|eukprot:KAG2442725.1 hypothetical protein HXX76_002807 [Chlamydomonas incerta]